MIIQKTEHVTPDESNLRSYNGSYKKLGILAENVAAEWLLRQPGVLGIYDFRNLDVMQDFDVDFGTVGEDRVTLYEVKYDYSLGVSGNVLFEIGRINHTSDTAHCFKTGWSARSAAEYFLLYAPQVQKLYLCRADDLRESFQRYTKEKRKFTQFQYIPTDNIKSTLIVLIPIEYCEKIFSIFDVTDIVDEINRHA